MMPATDLPSVRFVGERPDMRMHTQGVSQPMEQSAAQARHPVEKMLLTEPHRAEQQEMMAKAMIHGMHAPLRLKMERELLSSFQRLPGLPSSLVGLETVLGRDETIEFEDIFNLDANAPVPKNLGPNLSVHDVMEKRLNMRF